MALLGKSDILGADDLGHEDIEVPEWGGTVRVKTMTGADRDRYEASMLTGDGKFKLQDIKVRLVAMCLVDQDGRRLFGDADVRELGRKSARALDRVAAVCQRLNGLTDKEMAELAGNSGAAQTDGSPSG